MGILFTLFYQPIANLFYFFVGFLSLGELWLAVLILVFAVKLFLLPINIKALKIQALLKKMQPQLIKLKKNLKVNKQKQAETVMKLYKDHGINPFSPFIAFAQIPFFLAIFFFFRDLTDGSFVASEVLYNPIYLSIADIELNNIFLSIDFFENGGIFLALAVITSQYAYFKLSAMHIQQTKMQQTFIKIILVFIVIGCFLLPGIISLYWLFTNLISLTFDALYFRNVKLTQQETLSTN